MRLSRLGLLSTTLRVHGDASLNGASQGNAPRPSLSIAADFAVNVNPFGPADALVAAAHSADLAAYPDATAARLRHIFADWLGGTPEQYIFDAGACPILWNAARLFHQETKAPALIVGPTFSEYSAAAQACGVVTFELRSTPSKEGADPCNFTVDIEDIAFYAKELEANSVYLCNPNNPTGLLIASDKIHALAKVLDPCTLILDESFLALTSAWRELAQSLPGNVLRVRSLTKDYGLAGMRLGYATGRPDLIAALERSRAPWATSAASQAAGLVIPSLDAHLSNERVQMIAFRQKLESGLAARGLRVFAGSANFTLASHPTHAELPAALARHHVRVRDCQSFGLPGFIRLAARPEADRFQLFKALDIELARGHDS